MVVSCTVFPPITEEQSFCLFATLKLNIKMSKRRNNEFKGNAAIKKMKSLISTRLQPLRVERIYVSTAVKPSDRWLVQYIETACVHSQLVWWHAGKRELVPVAGYQWEQTIGWLCAVSMAHVCARCSGSRVWKARVSGRRWLNDTTYSPNSHSSSCALFEKK